MSRLDSQRLENSDCEEESGMKAGTEQNSILLTCGWSRVIVRTKASKPCALLLIVVLLPEERHSVVLFEILSRGKYWLRCQCAG